MFKLSLLFSFKAKAVSKPVGPFGSQNQEEPSAGFHHRLISPQKHVAPFFLVRLPRTKLIPKILTESLNEDQEYFKKQQEQDPGVKWLNSAYHPVQSNEVPHRELKEGQDTVLPELNGRQSKQIHNKKSNCNCSFGEGGVLKPLKLLERKSDQSRSAFKADLEKEEPEDQEDKVHL